MSLSGTIRRFANQCVTVTRSTGAWDTGRYINGPAKTFDIYANVQPAPPDTIQRLPEGQRKQGAKVVFPEPGSPPLRTAEAGDNGAPADLLAIDGELYEIAQVEPWRQHNRYVATRFRQ